MDYFLLTLALERIAPRKGPEPQLVARTPALKYRSSLTL
jgi:hypothetical protein